MANIPFDTPKYLYHHHVDCLLCILHIANLQGLYHFPQFLWLYSTCYRLTICEERALHAYPWRYSYYPSTFARVLKAKIDRQPWDVSFSVDHCKIENKPFQVLQTGLRNENKIHCQIPIGWHSSLYLLLLHPFSPRPVQNASLELRAHKTDNSSPEHLWNHD